MPPQNAQAPLPSPKQFEFMMKDQPKPPGRFNSLLAGVPKMAKIALAALGIIFLLVILYSVFLGGKTSSSEGLISIMASAQEIARVSDTVNQQTKNSDALSLSATASAVASSQEAQLKAYLKTQKVKVSPKMLLAKLDKNTDKQLTTALQNNNYEQTYYGYLKSNLASYQDALSVSYKTAGPNAKTILSSAFDSIKTLLSAPQLK